MTPPLQIEHLTFKHPDSSEPLFENLTVQFFEGWSGIVGPNGSGKTTLAQLICGRLRPENGTLRNNRDAFYCEQRTDRMPDNFLAFMEAYDGKAVRLRAALGIEESWQWEWEHLSHGERKRAQIAAALYKNPPILVLDEPTNHLDGTSKALLADALQRYKGIGILISHDRELLDNLCRHTLFLGGGKPDMRHVPYSVAKTEREKETAFQREQYERHGKTVKKLKCQVQEQRRKADRSDARVSKRHVDPKDIDTKKKLELAVFTGKDATDGKILSATKAAWPGRRRSWGRLHTHSRKGSYWKRDATANSSLLPSNPDPLTWTADGSSRFRDCGSMRGKKSASAGRTGSARVVFCAACWLCSHGPTGCSTSLRRSPSRSQKS